MLTPFHPHVVLLLLFTLIHLSCSTSSFSPPVFPSPPSSFPLSAAPSLYSALSSLRFLNRGTTHSTSLYAFTRHPVLYGEPENVTTVNSWWGAGGAFPILYQHDNSTTPTPCTPSTLYPHEDMPGGDLTTLVLSSPSPTLCQSACCAYDGCVAFTVAIAPTHFMNCQPGEPCCYLKGTVLPHVTSPIPNITSGLVNPASTPYTVHPPTGLRSAVPVGGVGAGSVELRGDGTFHEWTLINQSPGGAAKYGVVDQAVMGVRVGAAGGKGQARVIRTNPPSSLPGVATLHYSGSYPAGRLTVEDSALGGVQVQVYAYSPLRPHDLNRSVTPAFILSLNAHNPTEVGQDVSFFFNLPFGVEEDTARPGAPYKSVGGGGAVDCLHTCEADAKCMSWTWLKGNTSCELNGDIPLNRYSAGSASGVKGHWEWAPSHTVNAAESAAPTPLRHVRVGDTSPSSGDLSLWPTVSSSSALPVTFSYGVGDSLMSLFSDFADDGRLNSTTAGAAAHGATALTTTVPAGGNVTLSVVVSWHFPHRDHVGEDVGQFYANIFPSSAAAASSVLSVNGTGLQVVVEDILALHSTYLDSSLPEYLVDSLINSFSHVRSAMYVRDGTWRQWEAYDCNDVDSVHNDYQRHLPYILYFPETEVSKLRQHRLNQEADGMIQEELIGGCQGGTQPWDSKNNNGRHMADVTNLYVAEIYQMWKWQNPAGWLNEWWPSVKRAVEWEVGVSPKGLPEHLVDTYDIVGLDAYEWCMFNAVLHLLGMKAAMEMAQAVNDTATLTVVTASYLLGQQAINTSLWHPEGGFYKSYYNPSNTSETAVFADALYAQVVSNTLGLGDLLPRPQMLSHLRGEVVHNDSPYGLIVQTGREPQSNTQDNAIWMGGSQDWTSLAISLGVSPSEAYPQARKGMDNWRLRLNDQWNVWGLAGGMGIGIDGLHWCTSHYGFHMVLWHTPFAVSGQQWDARTGELSFEVKEKMPFSLPVLIPGMLGRIEGRMVEGLQEEAVYTLVVTMGEVEVKRLRIDGAEAKPPGKVGRGHRHVVDLTRGQTGMRLQHEQVNLRVTVE